jgi:hypothetical protein
MLQKIKTFAMVGICSIFTISNSTAQDKKVFDNVGVYFSPMLDIHVNYDSYQLHYDGWIAGLRTNVKLSEKLSINGGLYFGKGFYSNLRTRQRGVFGCESYKYIDNLDALIIKTTLHLNYDFIAQDNFQFYFLSGVGLNMHIKEKYDFIYVNNKIKLFNVLLEVGLGYSHNISDSFIVRLESHIGIPVWINYADGGAIQDNVTDIVVMHGYNTSSGINLGLIYKW